VNAIKEQADKYLHVMVYGEYAQEKPVELCRLLAEATPEPLEVTYLVNSGAEAIDGSLKLAKRHTGREEIIAFKDAYHGNTHGALSVAGNEVHKENSVLCCQWLILSSLIMKMILIKSRRKQLASL
jgi:4-aminobutyrate aminotransferase-like enzyme